MGERLTTYLKQVVSGRFNSDSVRSATQVGF